MLNKNETFESKYAHLLEEDESYLISTYPVEDLLEQRRWEKEYFAAKKDKQYDAYE